MKSRVGEKGGERVSLLYLMISVEETFLCLEENELMNGLSSS
jgi:hypothetical protein